MRVALVWHALFAEVWCSPLQIPQIVHQIWIDPPDGPREGVPSSPVLLSAMRDWRRALQPPWQYRLWNTSSAESFLGGLSPSLLDQFRLIAQWPERQKDFFAFNVLAHVGGVFADLDVVPRQAPAQWFGNLERATDVSRVRLLVGLEAHGSVQEAIAWRWSSHTQLAAWAFAAAPHHPAMVRAARQFFTDYETVGPSTAYGKSISMGPGRLTSSVDEWLQEAAATRLDQLESVRGRSRATAVADTVVLGIDGFGCGQAHSGSRGCNETDTPLLQHLFHGGWKRDAPSWETVHIQDESVDPEWPEQILALHAVFEAKGIVIALEAIPLLFSRSVQAAPLALPMP